MSSKPRQTTTGNQFSITHGYLYIKGVRCCEVDSPKFHHTLNNRLISKIRVESLSHEYEKNVWYDGVGYVLENVDCEMTLRREFRRGIAYWYAYRKFGGTLHKRYIGDALFIDEKKLLAVAQLLPGRTIKIASKSG